MKYISIKTMRETHKIVAEMFKNEKNKLPVSIAKKVWLLNIYIPFVNWNALTIATKLFGKRSWCIIVNKAVIAREASPEKRRFVANSILVHEFEHINIMSGNIDEMNYSSFMALTENITGENESFIKRFADAYISKNALQEAKKNQMYYSSAVELKCLHKGVADSMNKYGSLLPNEEYAQMKALDEALEMLENNVELRCRSQFITVNRFVESIFSIDYLYAKKPKKVQENSIINSLIPYNENFLSVKYLYENRDNLNKNLVDSFIMQIMLTTQNDFSPLFNEHPESKEYISELISEYIDGKNHFICNGYKTKLLIDDEFFDENMLHIKRNFDLLQKKVNEYGLTLTKTPAIWVA